MRVTSKGVEERFDETWKRGVSGDNKGLPLSKKYYKRHTKYICNVQRGRFDIVAGSTGSGKSSMILDQYIFNPMMAAMMDPTIDLHIMYFNMELPVQNVCAKYIGRLIFEDTGIPLSINQIFQKGDNRLSPEHTALVDSYRPRISNMLKYVSFYEGSITGKYMFMEVFRKLEKLGTMKYKKDTNIVESYTYHNPNTYIICIADHIGLLKKNQGERSLKESIDNTVNDVIIPTRNRYDIAWAIGQQMNRSTDDSMRMKSAIGPEPIISDLKDSSVPGDGADTIMAIYKPQDYNIDSYMNYRLKPMKDYFRCIKYLKNRDGQAGKKNPFGFRGDIGLFKELPPPEDIINGNVKQEDISKYFEQ